MTKQQIVLIGIGVGFLVVVNAVFIFGLKPGKEPKQTAALEFWGVEDPAAVYETAFRRFQSLYPSVKINYRDFPEKSYETELVNGLASGNGPDIFMVNHNWLPEYFDKLIPVPSQKFNLESLRNFFPQVVEQDFAPDGLLFALPLSIDTLVLYYNRDVFDQNAVISLPATWEDVQNVILQTRRTDSAGKIIKAGASIGGSENTIDRATDLLYLLMLQTGTEMTNPDFTQAAFNSPAGKKALDFYLKFSNPTDTYYTWNESLRYSLDAFANEETAMIFNYGAAGREIERRNPFLKFSKIAMPQPKEAEKRADYAEYWGYAVSNKSRHPIQAWDFILNLTTNFDNAKAYAEKTGKAPALRPLISSYSSHPVSGILAKQSLTARSWPQPDKEETRKIFSDMISDVLNSRLAPDVSLNQAALKVTRLMIK